MDKLPAPQGFTLKKFLPKFPVLEFSENGPDGKPRYNYFFMRKITRPGETLPIELVENRIRIQILNERKIKFLEDYETFSNAKADNAITIP